MHNVFGLCYRSQFDRKEAVRLARLALSLHDSDPDMLAMAAVISAFLVGDCESEIEMADARSYSIKFIYGMVCQRLGLSNAGLPEEAVLSFERAIRMNR